jgi:anti-sigma-K factor RskA
MNTPAESSSDDPRGAEYVLGVLDAAERGALEREMAGDAALRADVANWEARLMPLAEDVRAIVPPARVWTRIRADLGLLRGDVGAPRRGLWNNLDLWRWLGVCASVAAVVLVAVNLNLVRERQAAQAPAAPAAPSASAPAAASYLVATIARTDGVAHWTATVDLRRKEMVVVPAVHPTVAADRSTELWLIPPNAKPIPLGVFPSDQPAKMRLPDEIVARMNSSAVLAVSLEPHGGSPTGQPTGPVLATGALQAA